MVSGRLCPFWASFPSTRVGKDWLPLVLQHEGSQAGKEANTPEPGDAEAWQALHTSKGGHAAFLPVCTLPTPASAFPFCGSRALSLSFCVCVSVFVLLCVLGRRDSEWPGQLVGMVAAHPILSHRQAFVAKLPFVTASICWYPRGCCVGGRMRLAVRVYVCI